MIFNIKKIIIIVSREKNNRWRLQELQEDAITENNHTSCRRPSDIRSTDLHNINGSL